MNNYLKVSLRKFHREKLYSLINLVGLSLAIACCLILALYLRTELTYDQHNLKHDRIYRLVNEFTFNGSPEAVSHTSPVLGLMMAEEYLEIEQWAMLAPSLASLYRHEEDAFYWKGYATNERIFDIFTHDVIYGDPETALIDGSSIAVSESFAKKYFGDVNPIGETVTNDVGNPTTIDLVFADLPENSHVQYDVLLSTNRAAWMVPEDITVKRRQLWNTRGYTYLLMSSDFDIADFDQMAAAFYERHMAEFGRAAGGTVRFSLESLADVHYQSNRLYDEPTGSQAYLYALISVGLFILLVACINYVNLATARSVRHAKEVGIRKILGANKVALTAQFMAEAIILSLMSTLLALILIELVLTLTPVSELFGKTLSYSLAAEPQLLIGLGLFSLIVGAVAGLYPALYLSSWAPLSGLVSDSTGSKANLYFRKFLVLAQFTVSVTVVACTLLMADQMRYLSDKSLGFQKENRVVIELIGRDLLMKTPVIEAELLQNPNILGITTSGRPLGQPMSLNPFAIEQEDGQMVNTSINHLAVEFDYLDVMGMDLVAGRNFSQDIRTDEESGYIVNEAMVERFGWTNPIGKSFGQGGLGEGRVIGVVENFHFQSLHNAVDPFALRLQDNNWEEMRAAGSIFQTRYMTVNIAGESIRETIDYLEDRFREFDPKHPFQFQFLDESLEDLYQSEQRMVRLIGLFAGICIFIACLGLFGLASFTTEQRNKEIGIRKVLGASAGQIIYLLSRSMLSLVLIGAVVGCIAAYFAIDYWLGNFAYRAEVILFPYLIATITALFIAYTTVALQSYKTAQADPVDALRYE